MIGPSSLNHLVPSFEACPQNRKSQDLGNRVAFAVPLMDVGHHMLEQELFRHTTTIP